MRKTNLDANDRIILVRVKIERAKKHLLDLESELIRFNGKSAYVVGGNLNASLPVNLPILSWDSIAIAGDLVHNLRSALDHLANQLVWVGTGQEPTRQVCFPIAKDFATYEAEKAKKVNGMRELALKHIDNLKPYKGGNELLWRIHELENANKHRMLFTVAHDLLFVADWMPPSPFGESRYWLKARDPHFSGVFDPEVEKDVQLEIEKAFGRAKISKGDALFPSLQNLISFTEETIFSFRFLLE
jgi:hypothetical protein